MNSTIKMSEYLDALHNAKESSGDDSAFTAHEMANALGVTDQWARTKIRLLVEAGDLVNTRAPRKTLDGTVRSTSCFVVVEKG